MSEIKYNQKDLSEHTSELSIKYDKEEFFILNNKENIDKLYNVLAHMDGEIRSAKSEIAILKEQSFISSNDITHLRSHLNEMLKIVGADVIDYDENKLEKPMFSFQEFFLKFGYLDSNVELRPVDYKNLYYNYCNENDYECEQLGHILPIAFLEKIFGAENIRSVVIPGTSTYVYHIGINFNNNNDMIETKVVDNKSNVVNDLSDLVYESDLGFITADELYAYCHMKKIECGDTHNNHSPWFVAHGLKPVQYKNNTPFVWGELKYPQLNSVLRFTQNKRTKSKIIIDNCGGIKKLYEHAKKTHILGNVFNLAKKLDTNAIATYINFYLQHYNFDWKQFVYFARKYDNWEDCKQAIMERISSM